ncbi:MAG: RsiV family protein, partial [Terriglobales bacterium]
RSQWELDHLAAYGGKEEFSPNDAEGWLMTFDKPDRRNFQHFVFRDNNLVFFFDPYHVGPYAFGRRTVELQFNEIYKLLTDRMVELLIGRALE